MNTKGILSLLNDICEKHHIDNLDLIPKDGQEIFLKVIEEGILNPNIVKYKGLFTVIKNHIQNLKKQVYHQDSSFYGADRIRYMYHPKYNKYVYLIGETHRQYLPCNEEAKHLSDLIINYLKYSDKFIDVFLENTIKIKGINLKTTRSFRETPSNILYSIENKIPECLTLDKKDCVYSQVRFHNIDHRQILFEYYKNKNISNLYNFTLLFARLSGIKVISINQIKILVPLIKTQLENDDIKKNVKFRKNYQKIFHRNI